MYPGGAPSDQNVCVRRYEGCAKGPAFPACHTEMLVKGCKMEIFRGVLAPKRFLLTNRSSFLRPLSVSVKVVQPKALAAERGGASGIGADDEPDEFGRYSDGFP